MRLNSFRVLTLLLFVTTFLACNKKDDEPSNTTKTPKEILMASQWKKSEYKENGTVKPFFGSCEMDDVITFNATDWFINDGTTTCSTTTTSTDFYSIEADNKTFHWAYGVGELIFNSTNTSFTFKRTGANTFEYIFVKK